MNNTKIRLGVVGLSEGNGHPYSWSAICNGYSDTMRECPFPVIPVYLAAEPAEEYIRSAQVTHIWTQDRRISEHVAAASRIEHVVDSIAAMVGHIDGLLLARDDAETHYEMVREFIAAGGDCPIYVDKPLAFSRAEAEKIYALEKYPGQIFSCSAMRYAREVEENLARIKELGELSLIEAVTMKRWDTYSAHIIDPVLRIIGDAEEVATSFAFKNANTQGTTLQMKSGLVVNLAANMHSGNGIELRIFGERGNIELKLADTFYAFRGALRDFIRSVEQGRSTIPREHVMRLVDIIERGERL